jgi:hypothetical protein
LNNRSVKRPDGSYKFRRRFLPNPPPAWLKFLPNNQPYPCIVFEVAVNHESPAKLMRDYQRFFTRETSIRIWIGVKVWIAGKKFWVGYATRRPAGDGAAVQTQMQFPPNHHRIDTPTNIVYHIPMQEVFGPTIPVLAGLSPTVDVDVDVIRECILDNI